MKSLRVSLRWLFLTVPMAISEMRDFSQWCASINQSALWMSLLYAGVVAGTFAFTVQNVAQKYVDPTVSSLLMFSSLWFLVNLLYVFDLWLPCFSSMLTPSCMCLL